jgi:hypothetical protein
MLLQFSSKYMISHFLFCVYRKSYSKQSPVHESTFLSADGRDKIHSFYFHFYIDHEHNLGNFFRSAEYKTTFVSMTIQQNIFCSKKAENIALHFSHLRNTINFPSVYKFQK